VPLEVERRLVDAEKEVAKVEGVAKDSVVGDATKSASSIKSSGASSSGGLTGVLVGDGTNSQETRV
jgi:hypothetical protein